MDINKKMVNGIVTMNGEHTLSGNKHNRIRIGQSCKPFGVTDESECFGYRSLIYP